RSVSDMLILLGTTSGKLGITGDVAAEYAILVLGEVSRRTFPFSRGNGGFPDRIAQGAGHGRGYDAARGFRPALAWASRTPVGRAGRLGQSLRRQGGSQLADDANVDRAHRGRQD